jgi:hypothetical protein
MQNHIHNGGSKSVSNCQVNLLGILTVDVAAGMEDLTSKSTIDIGTGTKTDTHGTLNLFFRESHDHKTPSLMRPSPVLL